MRHFFKRDVLFHYGLPVMLAGVFMIALFLSFPLEIAPPPPEAPLSEDQAPPVPDYRWAHFTPNNAGLPAAPITRIAEDAEGAVWFGTPDHGAFRFDGRLWEAVETADFPQISDSGAPTRDDLPPLPAAEGAVQIFWTREGVPFAISDTGLAWWLPGGEWQPVTVPAGSALVRYLVQDSEGVLWAALNDGFARVQGDRVTRIGPVTLRIEEAPVLDETVTAFIDSRGAIWFGTPDDGVFRFARGHWESFIPATRGVVPYAIQDVERDALGILWIAAYHRGSGEGSVSALEPSGRWFFVHAEDSGLPSNDIADIYADPGGGVWFKAMTGEVSRLLGNTWTDHDAMPPEAAEADPRLAGWEVSEAGLTRASGAIMLSPANSGLMRAASRPLMVEEDGAILFGTDHLYITRYRPDPPPAPALAYLDAEGVEHPLAPGDAVPAGNTLFVEVTAWEPASALTFTPDPESWRIPDPARQRAAREVSDPGEICVRVADSMGNFSEPVCVIIE